MRQVEVVVEPVFDGWAGSELGFGPDFQDSCGQDVGGGVAQTFDVGHLLPLFEGFSFFGHGKNLLG